MVVSHPQCTDHDRAKFLFVRVVVKMAVDIPVPECERFVASMILGGVGDAIAYKGGEWEFCRSGKRIHEALAKLGGVENIKVNKKDWCVSDDTVMQIATAEALVDCKWTNLKELYLKIAGKYKECMHDMAGRAPGLTCGASVHKLKPSLPNGYIIPFNPRGGGCGAAMRSVPIGLYYWRPDQLDSLIAVSIESGRMTHNHPTGYLGSLATALLVSYALQGQPIKQWGRSLYDTLAKAKEYVKSEGRDVKENMEAWSYFEEHWKTYLTDRGIFNPDSGDIKFPDKYGIEERDKFYRSISFSGTGGASGHDAPMIAYDAILGAADSWVELCNRGMFHGGDSDSTGIIAGALYGAMHGFKGVPEGNYKSLEYRDRMEKLAKKIHKTVT